MANPIKKINHRQVLQANENKKRMTQVRRKRKGQPKRQLSARLTGSVLRDMQQPSWNEVSTPRSTKRDELAAIARRQKRVLLNQESLSKKLDHIISLLSVPVTNVPPAVIHTPPIPEPVPCTMPPASSPLDESTNPPEDTSIESAIPACQMSHEELVPIRKKDSVVHRSRTAENLLFKMADARLITNPQADSSGINYKNIGASALYDLIC